VAAANVHRSEDALAGGQCRYRHAPLEEHGEPGRRGGLSPTYWVRNRHHSVSALGGLVLVSQRLVDAVEGEGIVPLGCRFVPSAG